MSARISGESWSPPCCPREVPGSWKDPSPVIPPDAPEMTPDDGEMPADANVARCQYMCPHGIGRDSWDRGGQTSEIDLIEIPPHEVGEEALAEIRPTSEFKSERPHGKVIVVVVVVVFQRIVRSPGTPFL